MGRRWGLSGSSVTSKDAGLAEGRTPSFSSAFLQAQIVPLAVYLLGQPDLDDAKPSLACLLQRLAGAMLAHSLLQRPL